VAVKTGFAESVKNAESKLVVCRLMITRKTNPTPARQGREEMICMPEHWTPEEIKDYERAIRLAPKQRARAEAKRRRKLDELFDRLHGSTTHEGRETKKRKRVMKVKDGRTETTEYCQFYNDLFEGELKPEKMLENREDVKRLKEAMAVIKEFRRSCNKQIPDFELDSF
jgi:hypothetical protein